MARVSIILPMYNVAEYVLEAVQSLAAQTMDEFEAVCVDDGSTDSSAAIVERFAQDDPRFVVVRQTNRGPGPGGGRNGGLDAASGELLMFMDSDDILRPTALAELSDLLSNPAIDFATTSAQRLAGVTLRRSSIHDISHPLAESETSVEQSPWLMFDSTPWNKMFRREFFDRIVGTWPEQQLYEDIAPMTSCHLHARSVGVLTSPHYLWRSRGDGSSITQQRTGIDADLAQIEQLVEADRLVRAHGSSAAKAWLDWKAYTFDFVWMIRKLGLLGADQLETLTEAMASAMEEIGSGPVQRLGTELRACTRAVLARDHREIRKLTLTKRLAIVPDRRRWDDAAQTPFLNAVMVTSKPHGSGQHLITASDATRGRPRLVVTPTPPWHESSPDSDVHIEPASVDTRRGHLQATFHIDPHHLVSTAPNQPFHVILETGTARSELRRSLTDRIRGRLASGAVTSEIRRYFDDSMLTYLGPAQAPAIESITVDAAGTARLVSSVPTEIDPAEVQIRMSDSSGAVNYHYPFDANTNSFDIPTVDVTPGLDFFLAFVRPDNPGLPIPIAASTDTTVRPPEGGGGVALRASVNGQASLRSLAGRTKSITTELRRRIPYG